MSLAFIVVPMAGAPINDDHVKWYFHQLLTTSTDVECVWDSLRITLDPTLPRAVLYHVKPKDVRFAEYLELAHVAVIIELEDNYTLLQKYTTKEEFDHLNEKLLRVIAQHKLCFSNLIAFLNHVGLISDDRHFVMSSGNAVYPFRSHTTLSHIAIIEQLIENSLSAITN